jgi:hypothetical protein
MTHSKIVFMPDASFCCSALIWILHKMCFSEQIGYRIVDLREIGSTCRLARDQNDIPYALDLRLLFSNRLSKQSLYAVSGNSVSDVPTD